MVKRVISKELDSELMVYDPDEDTVHILNPTALLVYKLYSQGKQLSEIELEMRQRFTIDGGQDILAEIRTCITELQAKGLLSRD